MKMRYNTGMMKSVNTDAKASPATMLDATGPHSKELPPSPAARENNPAMVVEVVMRMGMTRRLPA